MTRRAVMLERRSLVSLLIGQRTAFFVLPTHRLQVIATACLHDTEQHHGPYGGADHESSVKGHRYRTTAVSMSRQRLDVCPIRTNILVCATVARVRRGSDRGGRGPAHRGQRPRGRDDWRHRPRGRRPYRVDLPPFSFSGHPARRGLAACGRGLPSGVSPLPGWLPSAARRARGSGLHGCPSPKPHSD
jgi:hypothetical protein